MCGSGSVYRSVAVGRVYECVALFITILNFRNFSLLLFDLGGGATHTACMQYICSKRIASGESSSEQNKTGRTTRIP
jgi:hypothetical protein